MSTEFMVACPTCGKKVVYQLSTPYRPFCSERCRLIDLGQWFEESYRVPVQQTAMEREEDA